MIKSTQPSRSRPFAIALGAAVITLSGLAAFAETRGADAPLQAVVTYADLDLQSDAGIKALHGRVTAAVRSVCPDEKSLDLAKLRAVQACREQATARAIKEIGSPRLAAMQESRKPLS
jgi:UrcA family protein